MTAEKTSAWAQLPISAIEPRPSIAKSAKLTTDFLKSYYRPFVKD